MQLNLVLVNQEYRDWTLGTICVRISLIPKSVEFEPSDMWSSKYIS